MARHRSPHGAETDDPEQTTRLRVVAPGGHRRPAPPAASLLSTPPAASLLPAAPAASLRNRATVAAVAAGAVVAAGQTMIPTIEPATVAPVTLSALLPVAEVTSTDTPSAFALDAIGGNRLLPDTLAIGALDPESQVDVENLAKAVDIGQGLARQASILDAALANGAAEAHLQGDTAFVRPAVGRFTSGFGSRWGSAHQGIDIANEIGTPIYAITDAVVEEAGPAGGYGLWIVLRHSDGTRSLYGHMNRIFVEPGQRVAAGEQIAEIGNRGRSTGPHLHLEIIEVDGTKINPLPWLQQLGIDY